MCDADGHDRRRQIEAARQQVEDAEERSATGGADLQSQSPPAEAGGLLAPAADSFPGYEIVRQLHRGGQGVVYHAIQKNTRRKVAIKVMREGPFADVRESARFDREVRILAQLKHPNIVAIHDTGTAAGHHYFVMDYVSGQALDAYAADAGRRGASVDDTLDLFARICEAVNVAHLRGIIHRDLKPGNIRVDANGEPHILDFGLAKVMEFGDPATGVPPARTLTGEFIGTLPWSSPEQAEGVPDRIDLRTDVYSLGVILYQTLTGQFPYQVVGNMREVVDNILTAGPIRPSTVRREINDEVETIVLKCLNKEPDRRYQSAGELARDVRHYLAGEPIEAKRDSSWYVVRKTVRRHRLQVAIAASIFLLILFAAAAVSHERGQTRQREAEAVRLKAITDEMNGVLSLFLGPCTGHHRSTVDEIAERLAVRERTGGMQPEAEVRLRDMIGLAYYRLGAYEEAEQQHRAAHRLNTKMHGRQDRSTLRSANVLFAVLRDSGQLEAAEALLRQTFDACGCKPGDERPIPDTAEDCYDELRRLQLRQNWAELLHHQGRLDQAKLIYDATLQGLRSTVQALDRFKPGVFDEIDSLEGQSNITDLKAGLARLLVDRGESAEAEALLRDILATDGRSALDDATPSRIREYLGLALLAQGRLEEAEALLAAALKERREDLPDRHPDMFRSLNHYGRLLMAQRRFDEAETNLRQAWQESAEALPNHWRTAVYQADHGASLTQLARYAEAEEQLLAAFDALHGAFGVDFRTRVVGDHLIAVYTIWSKPAKLRELRQRLGD